MLKIKKPFKITIICLLLLGLTGCGNTFYLTKQVDNFAPRPKSTFNIVMPKKTKEYNGIIALKLKQKLETIPLIYDYAHPIYSIYFNYNISAIFRHPRLTVIIANKGQYSLSNENKNIIYQATVYSYNSDISRSLASALKIITDDVLNIKYKASSIIHMSKVDLIKYNELNKKEEALKQKNSPPQDKNQQNKPSKSDNLYKTYRLFDKKSDYDW